MSLGGVRDEAEIRGHRRTYIGALPGPHHPGAPARRDARSGLHARRDRQDRRGLARRSVLRAAGGARSRPEPHLRRQLPRACPSTCRRCCSSPPPTRSTPSPAPLRDRMEILTLSGYTDEEKVGIAQQYLIPKQLAAHGLAAGRARRSSPRRIRQIVRGYTREAGVRNLEREIAAVARKVARRLAEGQREPVRVTADNVVEYLGRPRFFDEVAERTDPPGRGDRPGLDADRRRRPVRRGDHDAEHARSGWSSPGCSATSCARAPRPPSPTCGPTPRRSTSTPSSSRARRSTCTCRPGPSRRTGRRPGVTIVTALASLATRRPVRSDLAMTGEITLRGKVLPVGGIKEKVLAAHRAGIRTVILPRRNERDVEDVPEELRRQLSLRLRRRRRGGPAARPHAHGSRSTPRGLTGAPDSTCRRLERHADTSKIGARDDHRLTGARDTRWPQH